MVLLGSVETGRASLNSFKIGSVVPDPLYVQIHLQECQSSELSLTKKKKVLLKTLCDLFNVILALDLTYHKGGKSVV